MIVRELVAKFGVDMDDKGVKKAESSLAGLKNFALKVGAAISAGAVAKGLYDMVSLASQAADTMSLLKTTFGESADAVVRWADANADSLGRSSYKLREYATAIGVVAQGLTGSEQNAAHVGATFAKLAVDMKAFFPGTTDLDALGALRSALTGETEPMKRFGVVMDEASLAAFALSQGHRKLYKDMTAAEKTMVRFNFIVANSNMKKAWGAAGREAETFASRVERLKNKSEELGTKIGEKLLPAAEKLVGVLLDLAPYAASAADAISRLARETYVLEGIATVTAIVALPSLVGALISLYTTIKTRALLAVVGLFTNLGVLTGWLTTAATATWAFVVAWAPIAAIVLAVGLLAAAVYALWQQFTTGRNFIAEWTEEAFGLQTALGDAIWAVHTWVVETWGKIETFVTNTLEKIRGKLADVLPKGVLSFLAKVGVDLRTAGQNAGARTAGGPTVAPGSTVSSRNVNVTNGAVTVNIQGGATPATAQAVGREVQKALDNNNRNLAASAPTGA